MFCVIAKTIALKNCKNDYIERTYRDCDGDGDVPT